MTDKPQPYSPADAEIAHVIDIPDIVIQQINARLAKNSGRETKFDHHSLKEAVEGTLGVEAARRIDWEDVKRVYRDKGWIITYRDRFENSRDSDAQWEWTFTPAPQEG